MIHQTIQITIKKINKIKNLIKRKSPLIIQNRHLGPQWWALQPAAESDSRLSSRFAPEHARDQHIMEEPNIFLGCAVCRQSNRLKKSIKTTWKSSEALGKMLLRGRGMCAYGTDGHSNEKRPKVIRVSKPEARQNNATFPLITFSFAPPQFLLLTSDQYGEKGERSLWVWGWKSSHQFCAGSRSARSGFKTTSSEYDPFESDGGWNSLIFDTK